MNLKLGDRVMVIPLDAQNIGGWAKVVSDEPGDTHVHVQFEDRAVNVATPRDTPLVNRGHVGEYIDALEQRALMQGEYIDALEQRALMQARAESSPGWLSITFGSDNEKEEVLCGRQKVRGVQDVIVVKKVQEPVEVWIKVKCSISVKDRAPGP